MRRALVLLLLAVAAFGTAGCAGKKDAYTKADTEGLYLRADGMNYQIQLSRELNPAIIEDSDVLKGVTESVNGRDQVWFGVWLRVDNPSKQAKPRAVNFVITDTQGKEFRPVTIDASQNILAYQPGLVPPGAVYPPSDTAQSTSGPREGGMLLFRLDTSAYQNRPLDLDILSSDTPERVEATVKLDL